MRTLQESACWSIIYIELEKKEASMTLLPPKKSLFSILTILFVTLTLSIPATANIGDWGMVQHFNKLKEMAESGKVQAMYDVGKLYERGRGVNKNRIKAAEWFQKAALSGHASAQARLGILYFEGRGVNQDYNKALRLLNAAAKQKIPSAYYQLANMYELGTGVKQDLYKSIAWYQKAKQSGYYLAEDKIKRLQKRLHTGAVNNKSTQSSKSALPLIQTLLKGRWLKSKVAVGYLPSIITNCSKNSYSAIRCISTSQERSTGTEIITYNTESIITATSAKSFNIVYTNNVLEVSPLASVDGDGQTIKKSSSRIKKGKQGKKRKLTCKLKNNKTLTCSKSSSTFILVSRQ